MIKDGNPRQDPRTCQNLLSNMTIDLKLRSEMRSDSKIGKACSKDQHCGFKEVCYKTDVTPPCLEGKCACENCYAPGSAEICVPIQILQLGAPCANTPEVEVYPEHASCLNRRVQCNVYYKVSVPFPPLHTGNTISWLHFTAIRSGLCPRCCPLCNAWRFLYNHC